MSGLPMRRRISPWAALFGVITAWHLWRGAGMDTAIFAAATALLVVESLRPDWLGTRHKVRVSGRVGLVVCVVSGSVFVLTPRYSPLTIAVLVVLGAGAFFMVWYHVHQRYRPALTRLQRTAIHVWLTVATFLLLVEFAAYMGATASGSDERFPTITVLLDPSFDHPWGRAVFAAGWLLGGWALVTVSPRVDAP